MYGCWVVLSKSYLHVAARRPVPSAFKSAHFRLAAAAAAAALLLFASLGMKLTP